MFHKDTQTDNIYTVYTKIRTDAQPHMQAGRHTGTDTHTERHTYRKTHIQKDAHTESTHTQKDAQTETRRQRDTHTERHTGRQAEAQAKRHTGRYRQTGHTGIETYRKTHRQKETQADTDTDDDDHNTPSVASIFSKAVEVATDCPNTMLHKSIRNALQLFN